MAGRPRRLARDPPHRRLARDPAHWRLARDPIHRRLAIDPPHWRLARDPLYRRLARDLVDPGRRSSWTDRGRPRRSQTAATGGPCWDVLMLRLAWALSLGVITHCEKEEKSVSTSLVGKLLQSEVLCCSNVVWGLAWGRTSLNIFLFLILHNMDGTTSGNFRSGRLRRRQKLLHLLWLTTWRTWTWRMWMTWTCWTLWPSAGRRGWGSNAPGCNPKSCFRMLRWS